MASYNTEVRNEDALPIPYAVMKGDNLIHVTELEGQKFVALNMQYMTFSPNGQAILHCMTEDGGLKYVFDPRPGLLIKCGL